MRLLKIVPDNTNIGFVRLRFVAFGFTILLTLASIGLLATRGLNLGVDFVGGLMIEAGFSQAVPLDELRKTVNGLNVGEVSLQQFGGPNNVAIRLPLPPGDETAAQAVVKRVQASIAAKHPDVSFRRVDTVSGQRLGRADPQRHLRRAARGARHRRLHLGALRMAFRRLDARRACSTT